MRCARNCSSGLVKQARNKPLPSGALRGLVINHLQRSPQRTPVAGEALLALTR
jgi:hypothetical protein